MKEVTKAEKAFSPEAKAEAVARFSEALNREDIDGFVFGVSTLDGNLCAALTGDKGTLTHILEKMFVDAGLNPGIFMKGVALHTIAALGKEDDND